MTDSHDERTALIAAFKAAGLHGTAKRPTRAQIDRASDVLASVTEWFDLTGEERDAIALVRDVLYRMTDG